ncbi:MAG: hypothetical protein UHS54_00150 [Lachnospiraceae bacterium]|nr:hypothetical protein [Lachnospiraceae bacterium]MEE1248100.1 hypothetical protein [Lachnospiraceae bacterium]
MSKRVFYQYYVEGPDDKCVLNALKSELRCIESGKVEIFNVVQERFNAARIRTLKQNTVVILVYDTDVEVTDTLRWNINFLNKQSVVKEVLCIPQVKNLEEELKYACQVKHIGEITHSNTKTDYKRDLIKCTNLANRLKACKFDAARMWSRSAINTFNEFGNDAEKIKL